MPEDTPQPGWTYKPGNEAKPDQAPHDEEQASAPADESTPVSSGPQSEPVSWTASEFVANHKTAAWYLLFVAGLAACSGLIFILTRDVISAGAISFAGVLFLMLASRKPREMPYKVDSEGITIGIKFYPYNLFKSFGVEQEGAIGAINLMPLKRFMPELSIYYPPSEEDKILSIIADHLPHEQREEHSVDRLLKKIRF